MKTDIAGVLVDNISKSEVLQKIDEFVAQGSSHQIVTTYSEFVVFASRDLEYLAVLNQADLSLPDGSGILWAAKYLSLNASHAFEAFVQVIWTGASLIFAPSYVKSIIREKISGSQLIWDIAKLAAEKNYSLALVGGGDSVAALSARALKAKFPTLRVNLAISGGKPFDEQTAREIAESNSDILLIAYQPPAQEKWIAANLSKLNVKVAMGVGGTLDYLSGKRVPAPTMFTSLGLEWLWRLISQPWRWKRMWNAIPVFISIVYNYKLNQIHGKS